MNITSLPKHLEELKIFLQQIPFEILSLNETRLDDTIENNTVRIPGYNIIRIEEIEIEEAAGLLF